MSRQRLRAAILVVVGIPLAAIIWFGVHTWRIDYGIGQAMGMERLLTGYAVDHGGRLPSGPEELFEKGYCFLSDHGSWRVPRRDSHGPGADYNHPEYTIVHPDYFDIAWGVRPTDVDNTGRIVSQGRPIMRPIRAKARYLESGCNMSSRLIARAMLEQQELTASRPQ